MLALLQKFLTINQGGHMAATNKEDLEKLLKDQRIIDEINRHLWIESEKAGHDIGFEQAKADWFKKFSKAWIAYNMPELAGKENKSQAAPKYKEAQAAKPAVAPKRRAKSYL